VRQFVCSHPKDLCWFSLPCRPAMFSFTWHLQALWAGYSASSFGPPN
jgi:hypothetical protein